MDPVWRGGVRKFHFFLAGRGDPDFPTGVADGPGFPLLEHQKHLRDPFKRLTGQVWRGGCQKIIFFLRAVPRFPGSASPDSRDSSFLILKLSGTVSTRADRAEIWRGGVRK